jgi:phosphoglycolate phosphatase
MLLDIAERMAYLQINNMLIQTVIFDFDGTLAKLTIDFQLMRLNVLKIISSFGVDTSAIASQHVLEMMDEAAAKIKNTSSLQREMFLAEAKAVIENIELEAAAHGELFERTKELLTELNFKNISCGIITRNCRKAVCTVFPDILSYCPVVVCRNDVSRYKPHPDHLNKALQMLQKSPSNALMVGDHPLDVLTGLKTGTKTAGVLTGTFHEEDFVKAGADIILTQAADLLDYITA